MDRADINDFLWKIQFGARERQRVYRKLATFLRNGVPLNESLRIMYFHASDDGKKANNPTAQILLEWRRAVSNGSSFGKAVAGWVPEGDRILLDAGEQSGLDEAIRDAMFIQNARKKIMSTIFGGMTYPAILTLVCLGFMIMLAERIVPSFEDVLPRERWQGAAANMAMIADFVNDWLLYVALGVAAVVATVVYSFPRWVGRWRVFADRIPPWSLYRLYSGAGFMLVLSALTKAGVQQTEILKIIRRGAGPWYDERISGALRHVANGANLGQALWLTGLGYPDVETVKDLRSYAEQDGFDEILRELGVQWIEQSIEKIQSQTNILRNLSFMVFGIVFGSIASGIFALEQQLASVN